MNISDKKERCLWVDAAKGISIFLIVLGHVYTSPILRRGIYSFHVPIFFFLSGLTFNKSGKRIKDRLKSDFISILIPYYLVSIISIVLFCGVGEIIFEMLGRDPSNYLNMTGDYSIASSIKGMIYANSKMGNMQWNLPLWFLPCFFSTKTIAVVLEPYLQKSNRIRLFGIGTIAALAIIYQHCLGWLYLPFQIETAISMLVWFELGILISPAVLGEEILANVEKKRGIGLVCAVILIILATKGAFINGSVQVRIDQYSNIILYYLVAAAYITSVVLISVLVKSNKAIRYIGRRTLAILLLHKFPVIVFQLLFKKILQSDNLVVCGLAGIVVSIISIGLCMCVEIFVQQVWEKYIKGNTRED